MTGYGLQFTILKLNHNPTQFLVSFNFPLVWHPNQARYKNPFLYFWILASLISSCYSFYWDVKMDWGLFDPNCGENKYLREEIVYRHKAFYYFAIIEDLILRFTWTVTLTVTEVHFVSADILLTLLAPCELFR